RQLSKLSIDRNLFGARFATPYKCDERVSFVFIETFYERCVRTRLGFFSCHYSTPRQELALE
ncbi:MAG TPA: hypothetical protein VFS12_17765, partial [Terriglobia bacterium]|nr:hypothetical protein [Terriglobia bacterium]